MSQTQAQAVKAKKPSRSKRSSKGRGGKPKNILKKKPGHIIMDIPGEGRVSVSKNTFEPNLYSVVQSPKQGRRIEIRVLRHGTAYVVQGTCHETGAWSVTKAYEEGSE